MKLLIVGINYSPELTGIGKYTAEMCTWLAAQGHQVDVITAMPYYPEWKVNANYRGKWWHTEQIKGVRVFRSPLYVPAQASGMKRMIHEFTFLLSSSIYWFKALFTKYDVVMCVCPPYHLGFMGWLYKLIKGTPVIYHIQDLQVDAARNLGMLKNERLLNFLEASEKFILKRMTKVSSISPGMKKNILKKGVDENRYINLPNWVDTDFIQPLSKEESLKADFGYAAHDKVVLYSGNMGEKQGLEIVMATAEKLKADSQIHFLFVGEGASKQRMQDYAQQQGLKNVKFLPLQPYNQLSRLLAVADIHLVIQKSLASDLMLPSKLLSILSSGGFVIVTANQGTSLYEMITKHQAGVVIAPENTEALVEAIQQYSYADTTAIRLNARNYAINELTINKILLNFEQELEILTK